MLTPQDILPLWTRWSSIPGGSRLFMLLLGRAIPYTGTLRAQVCDLRKGHALVELSDRRLVRNHLGSIHAAALMNLAELASGLAFNTLLPPQMRGIVTNFSITYLKKARGRLRAAAHLTLEINPQGGSYEAPVEIRDADDNVVASAIATWQVRPNG